MTLFFSGSSIQVNPIRKPACYDVYSLESSKEEIKKLFRKVELSVSSYDTAWVAMIPSPITSQVPCFPQCLNWLLDNQLSDGSWGLHNGHPLLMKDHLLSTLACSLALKKWGVGADQMNKGIRFIESKFSSLGDDKQFSPIGFDIIFPSLIELSQDLELNLPLGATDIEQLFRRREAELTRGYANDSEGWRAYLAYVSEGMGNSQNWEMVMKHQRKNGSLFNSPATTAAAFTHFQNAGCYDYLRSVLEHFQNAVPTIYPLDTYSRLCMVDSLERLDIRDHFRDEIRSALEDIHRDWQQGDEDIILNPTNCAMAFRILRCNGYDVSSDALSQHSEDKFSNSMEGYLKDVQAVLELYKASQLILDPRESALEELKCWTRQFLMKELSPKMTYSNKLNQYTDEVNEALKSTYHANLECVSSRIVMESYDMDNTRILKTAYRCCNLANMKFLKLAVEDYNGRQSIYQEEYKQLTRWVKECRFERLKFARQKLDYCYFASVAILSSPENADFRIAFAKTGVLTTYVDDLFDVGGSEQEMINLINLVEKWNVDSADIHSEPVEILFSAIKGTICEIAEKTYRVQGRCVQNHVIEIWLNFLRSLLKEAEWSKTKAAPTVDEYMRNAAISYALGCIILTPLYLVGPKLSRETVESAEYHSLFELMSVAGRLLNDIASHKREVEEGKLNAVALRMIEGNGVLTEEEVIEELKGHISCKTRELFRLVLQPNGNMVPKECKDVFWKMAKVSQTFYMGVEGFSTDQMMTNARALIKEPIVLNL